MSKNKKILLVEDEIEVCEILNEIISAEGYEVQLTGSGEEAVNWIRDENYDLIILDVRLRGMTDGISVVKKIQAFSHKPKIILVSATPRRLLDALLVQENIQQYINHILEKPGDMRPDIIIRTLQALLG